MPSGLSLRSLAAQGPCLWARVFGCPSLNTSLSYLVIMDNMYHLVSNSYVQAPCLKLLLYMCSLIECSQKITKVPFIVLIPFTDEEIRVQQVK